LSHFENIMKILVTGGCGFLGSNIAASYLKLGEEVVVVDALFRQGGASNLAWLQETAKSSGSAFSHHQLDLADGQGLAALFVKHGPFDYVCHLGGQVAMTTSIADPVRDFRTNALGTLNLLEAVRKHSPGAFLAYSSTNKVYGDLAYLRYVETETRYTLPDYPNGLDESLPLDFASPYGCSKGAADQYVRDYNRTFGLKTVVFRHSSIYGGRQFSTFDQGWVGWFVRQALEQKAAGASAKPFAIAGSGKQVRDVLHADDLIALYHAAYNNRDSVSGKIFNVGGGIENSLSLLELFRLLEELVEIPQGLRFERTPRRQSDQDFFVANTQGLTQCTGWKATVSAEQGIRRMIDWVAKSI
jgi:CDP-paratose 2-epimerase